MKKKTIAFALVLCMLGTFLLGVAAGGNLQEITAYLNHGISIAKDGQVQALYDEQGNTLTPITYNNSTYLPVRAISNILGHQVGWDGTTQCVLLDNSAVPQSLVTPVSGSTTVPALSASGWDLNFLREIINNLGSYKYEISNLSTVHMNNWVVNVNVWGTDDIALTSEMIFVTTSDFSANNSRMIELQNALCKTLVDNGYHLAKEEDDEFHYVKGDMEIRIEKITSESRYSLYIVAETNWQSCCAEGAMYF